MFWLVARVFYVAARCFPPVWHEGSVSVIWSTVGSCWGVAMVFWVVARVLLLCFGWLPGCSMWLLGVFLLFCMKGGSL